MDANGDDERSAIEFSKVIFDKVRTGKIEYMDAIVSYCEDLQIDVEAIVDLISPSLKLKLMEEATSLRLIKSSSFSLDL
jgi:hypothetical protein